MDTEILFAAVPMSDIAASVAWYSSLFARAPDVVPHAHEAMWRVSEGGWLYVVRDAGRAGSGLATISVPDLDAALAGLAARGIVAGPIEPVGAAGRRAVLADPDGNQVHLIEIAASA